MNFLTLTFIAISCLMGEEPSLHCPVTTPKPVVSPQVLGVRTTAVSGPIHTGEAVDVELSAQSVLAWDVATGAVLYSRQAEVERPIASLNKLLSVLTVRQILSPETIVEIPAETRAAQQAGADIQLPIGQHTSTHDLLAASLIASANDAMVTLAIAASGSEEAFVQRANQYAKQIQLQHTKMANSTGLSGGEQYSNAHDVRALLMQVYSDPILRPWLSAKTGALTTVEGVTRQYKTTNKLLGTYIPIEAAKTGYTIEAGENLAVITRNAQGQAVGAVILGSKDRFQDMKVLLEWVWRNYTWSPS